MKSLPLSFHFVHIIRTHRHTGSKLTNAILWSSPCHLTLLLHHFGSRRLRHATKKCKKSGNAAAEDTRKYPAVANSLLRSLLCSIVLFSCSSFHSSRLGALISV